MTKYRILVISCSFCILLSATAFVDVRSQQAQKGGADEEATPIKRGDDSLLRREHSKLYKGQGIGRNLEEIEEGALVFGPGLESGFTGGQALTLPDIVLTKVCRSDAIVIGRVKAKYSQLTTEGDFIFTDYTVHPKSVLKENQAKPIEKSKLIVTRPGGKVNLEGRILQVEYKDAEQLVSGSLYLLFLKHLPTTNTYKTLPGTSLVPPDGKGKLKKLTGRYGSELPADTDFTAVTELIKAYGPTACEKTK